MVAFNNCCSIGIMNSMNLRDYVAGNGTSQHKRLLKLSIN